MGTGALTPNINSQAFGACASFSDDEGLTHTSSDDKTSAMGTWTAPATGDASIRWTVLTSMKGKWFIEKLDLSPSDTASPAVCSAPAPAPPIENSPNVTGDNDTMLSGTAPFGPSCLALVIIVFCKLIRL